MELGEVPGHGVQGDVGVLQAEALAVDPDPGHASVRDVERAHAELLPIEKSGDIVNTEANSLLGRAQT